MRTFNKPPPRRAPRAKALSVVLAHVHAHNKHPFSGGHRLLSPHASDMTPSFIVSNTRNSGIRNAVLLGQQIARSVTSRRGANLANLGFSQNGRSNFDAYQLG